MSHISLMLAQSSSAGSGAAAGAMLAGLLMVFLIIGLGVYVVMALSFSKLLAKAGKEGWPGWVPIYNAWRMFEISGKHGALSLIILGAFIPFVGFLASIAFWILLGMAVGKAFNQGTGMIVGMILLPVIFYPILAFGGAQYGAVPVAQGFPVGPAQ